MLNELINLNYLFNKETMKHSREELKEFMLKEIEIIQNIIK